MARRRKPQPDDKRPEDIDPQHVLNAARGFLATYRLLRNPLPPKPNGEFNWYPVQATVLGAFALELFLKYLLARDGKDFSDGHEPSRLFRYLNPETKGRIGSMATELGDLTLTPEQIEASLVTFDRMFVTSRYIYEKTGASASLVGLDGMLAVMNGVTSGQIPR